jgi:hypothetical protein
MNHNVNVPEIFTAQKAASSRRDIPRISKKGITTILRILCYFWTLAQTVERGLIQMAMIVNHSKKQSIENIVSYIISEGWCPMFQGESSGLYDTYGIY